MQVLVFTLLNKYSLCEALYGGVHVVVVVVVFEFEYLTIQVIYSIVIYRQTDRASLCSSQVLF